MVFLGKHGDFMGFNNYKWWIYGDLMVFVGKNGDSMGFNHYKWWIYGDLMVMIMVIYVGKIVILMGWIPLYMVDLW